MPVLFIKITNSRFCSRDEGFKYENSEAALASGVQSAVVIIADEINRGECSAAIEVSVEREDGTQLLRSIVATSVSPLIPLAEAMPLSTIQQ